MTNKYFPLESLCGISWWECAVVIATIAGFISGIIYFGRFCNWIKSLFSVKYRQQKEIYILIKEWYDYVDIHLDDDNFNINKLNNIEGKINFLFQKNKNLNLSFSKRFMKKSLKISGVNINTRDSINQFIKYVGLDSEYNKLALALEEKNKKKSYNLSNYPYRIYWQFIFGNFYSFYHQYKKNWKDIEMNKRITWPKIENPIKILKIYFSDN